MFYCSQENETGALLFLDKNPKTDICPKVGLNYIQNYASTEKAPSNTRATSPQVDKV